MFPHLANQTCRVDSLEEILNCTVRPDGYMNISCNPNTTPADQLLWVLTETEDGCLARYQLEIPSTCTSTFALIACFLFNRSATALLLYALTPEVDIEKDEPLRREVDT